MLAPLLPSIESKSSGGSRTVAKTTPRAGQRGKSIEEVLAYSLGHRIRVYVLTLLRQPN
jgi:hypothetical protein